jgi:transposase
MDKIRIIMDKLQRLFVGIDIHKKSWTVTIRTRDEEVKTDKKDSRKLAKCLADGVLKRVYVPTPAERAARAVSRRRRQLIGDRRRVQCRIKAVLSAYGVALPTPRGKWSAPFRANLGLVRLHDRCATESYQELLIEYDQLSVQIKRQTQLLEQLAQTDVYRERVALLCTLPGVEVIVAMEFLLELQDIRRFRSARTLSAYLGLTPSERSSGEHIRLGSITRAGKGSLRGLLVQGSWRAIAKDAGLRYRYECLKARIGGKRAVVAIARHLGLIARRLLLEGRPYQAEPTVAC